MIKEYEIKEKSLLPGWLSYVGLAVLILLMSAAITDGIGKIQDRQMQPEFKHIRERTAALAPEPEYLIGKKGQKIYIKK